MQATKPQTDWIVAALERYERPLTTYAFRILGDVELARDVVQDTFLKLCNQNREELSTHLAEWLYTVCRNGALDLKRKDRGAGANVDLEDISKPSRAPIELLERDEAAAVLRETLQKLTEREQEILRLRFQGGLSYKEIANITNQSISHVGFIIHTGIQKLRSKLTKTQMIPRVHHIQTNPKNGAIQP